MVDQVELLPVTDQERWAEAEAQQCERSASYLREECVPGWLKKAAPSYHPLNMKGAWEAAAKAQFYDEMAAALRRPRYIRIEQDAYRTRTPTTPERSDDE